MPTMRTKSAEEIDSMLLDVASWDRLSAEDLWEFLNISLVLYGIRQDGRLIPYLSYCYMARLMSGQR